MDLTQGTNKEKNARAKKMMLWFGIVSLIMGFAGWTSAYIVSSKRKDWLQTVELPQLFLVSTTVIVLSSLTFVLARMAMKKGATKMVTAWLLVTFGLGIAFIVLQFLGFNEMIMEYGYRFTGPTSNIKMSYVYLIAAVHIVHVVAGLLVLLGVTINHLRAKYTPEDHLGLELGAMFWHFLDFLWVYLVLFMYFVK
ncbi:cytochrome c oxidase subunit 3 [Flavobacterium sp. ASW18X]|uniref:cytochrome c oxidase subunit 3 n=1 Tax=Flavobacterium sp. ASW18X TaxID=2572595 RepID=UPI0010AE5E26|nr:cytochrome c oxidase subunit 3 [Flavobacterium sp. ASW18X]TKD66639.1 heme-copper oxidase subunit III [Flavobacterium sp. ASW18X]